MTQPIRTLEERIDSIEEAMARAASGDFSVLLDIDDDQEHDHLTSIEYGVNLMLRDVAELRDQELKKTQQLEEMLEFNKIQTRQLEATLEIVQKQQLSIAELSTPVLQLWDNVLAMPIIGVVDSKRSADIMARLLDEVSTKQSQFVILDVTGVEVVDTKTADHFIKVIRAAELLGARCVLSGIRPAVAQTLVDIGVDLSSILTVSNLREALKSCLRQMGKNKSGNSR